MKILSVEYEKDKQSLTKRAMDAEEKLKAAAEELGGLKKAHLPNDSSHIW